MIKQMKRKILTIISILTLTLVTLGITAPKLVQAEEVADGVIQGQSLVQCGGTGQPECTLCHVFILLRDIFNFALQILASLAVLSVFIGGVYMLVSGANPSMFAQGVQIIQYAIIGIILTGASFVILNTLLVILGFQSTSVAGALTGGLGEEGSLFFSVECDTANYFQDRGPEEREVGDNTAQNSSGGNSTGGGNGGAITCTDGACANNSALREAIENNKYNVESNLLLALFDAGEGCNPAVRFKCNQNGWSDSDCSCGYSQCTPDIRAASTGISDPKASCDLITSDIQADVDCAAWLLNEFKERCGTEVRNVASCYNSGIPNNCANTTPKRMPDGSLVNYCDRIENYYNSC
jgi:hypothetical protein